MNLFIDQLRRTR